MTITDLITNFGDVFELSFRWDVARAKNVLDTSLDWVQYNPRKPHINRQGLSVTSLDGKNSGVPDLDSVREYNQVHGTKYSELDFQTLTPITDLIPETKQLIEKFPSSSIGRCHFIRLGAGGFFPPHRDNGMNSVRPDTFRVISVLDDFHPTGANVWLQEGRPLTLFSGRTYFINTTKVHSVFSFEGCEIFVMNIVTTKMSLEAVMRLSSIS